MAGFPLLTIITFLPLLGALFLLLFVRRGSCTSEAFARNVKNVSLLVTSAVFVLSMLLWIQFDVESAKFQFTESHSWFEGRGIGYNIGIDGISLFFILLTTALMPLCVLASWSSIKEQIREYMIAFLLLETLMIGVFVSMDFVLFFFFFEASLIPMFLIIGVWGGANRVYAAFKFFLYTLTGSVMLLLAMLYIYQQTGTAFIPDLHGMVSEFSLDIQIWLWLAFFVSFAVKVPMWPFHTWLPDAHVQAPTAGSMVLAGILLKMGAYGFLRFSLPMLPDASELFAPMVFWLSVIGVIYASLVALAQEDMKKLIAYSSVAHMGFVTAGIFSLNVYGVQGALFQMLSHGVVSAALFYSVGVLYERRHTKEISYYGGIASRMPRFALLFLFFTMASIGLPATSGFVGEFLIMLGVFQENSLVAALIATGVVLGAAYMLWLYRRVMFGEITNPECKDIKDINVIEKVVLGVLAIITLVFGIYPSAILDVMEPSVQALVAQVAR